MDVHGYELLLLTDYIILNMKDFRGPIYEDENKQIPLLCLEKIFPPDAFEWEDFLYTKNKESF
jgi:hypothetical protein